MRFQQLKSVAKTLRSKVFILIVSFVFVVSSLILGYLTAIKDFSIFPYNNDFEYISYTDGPIGGNSIIEKFEVSDSLIRMLFKLNSTLKSPYVGLSIAPKNGSTFDLSYYNQINIKVRANGMDNIGLSLYIPKDNLKNIKSEDVIFYNILAISKEVAVYSVPIRELKIPDWWYETNNLKSDTKIKLSLDNIKCINFNNTYTQNLDEQKLMEIYSVTFTRNNKSLLLSLVAANLIIAFLTFLFIRIIEMKQANKSSITITYRPIEIDEKVNSKSNIFNYINNNFHRSDLTLEMVSEETGISKRKITALIQQQFDCNFKTYLNRLRINESKRLLLETGFSIKEIAFRIGFNNQSHFNRVFKIELNISPSEYRDKHTKSNL